MKKKYLKTEKMVIYYDGKNFHFGENQKEDLFVSEIECFAQWFTEKELKNKLSFGKSKIISLYEAIESKDLTKDEVEFLECVSNLKQVSWDKLRLLQVVFNAEASPRLQAKSTIRDLKDETEKLREEVASSGDEMV